MASPAYAEAHETFGRYALRFVAKELAPVSAEAMEEFAAIVRDAEAFISEVAAQPDAQAPDLLELVEEVRALHARVSRVLAVAGLDASWVRGAEKITLSPEDSIFIADLLENPPDWPTCRRHTLPRSAPWAASSPECSPSQF